MLFAQKLSNECSSQFQSDMEVSASEADDRGFSGGAVTLDRVTKEQLYAAYKRTQERYKKYRSQYGDLARHYKLLERENAKARVCFVNIYFMVNFRNKATEVCHPS